MANKTSTTVDPRLEKAKVRHNPPKAETPKVVSPATSPATVLEDQKSVAPATGGDQKDTSAAPAKSKKKDSGTVGRWKVLMAQKAFADGKGTITLTAKGKGDKPKRNKGTSKFGALDRFRLYKDGMTVKEYHDACIEKGVGGEAIKDVRWDVAQGLIEVK